MAHKRVRPFNTRDTYPEQKLDNDLAKAVVARGTTVFLRGQVGQDLETGAHIDHRQLTAVDAAGRVAVHHGARTLGTHAHAEGPGAVAAGNILSSPAVPQAMIEAFDATPGHLGDRLIAANRAAIAAGGEEGPVHSAGMKLVDKVPWPVADLRIDWSDDDPIEALARLWALYKPQLDDYVTRALNPAAAPSYGVPGDD